VAAVEWGGKCKDGLWALVVGFLPRSAATLTKIDMRCVGWLLVDMGETCDATRWRCGTMADEEANQDWGGGGLRLLASAAELLALSLLGFKA
jgi:hypothetical protein